MKIAFSGMKRMRVLEGMEEVVCNPIPRPGRAAGVIEGWISTPLEMAHFLKIKCFLERTPGGRGGSAGPSSESLLVVDEEDDCEGISISESA